MIVSDEDFSTRNPNVVAVKKNKMAANVNKGGGGGGGGTTPSKRKRGNQPAENVKKAKTNGKNFVPPVAAAAAAAAAAAVLIPEQPSRDSISTEVRGVCSTCQYYSKVVKHLIKTMEVITNC